MTIELELETEDIVQELVEDHGFVNWLDERIEDRIPEVPEEFVMPDDVVHDYELNDYVRKDSIDIENAVDERLEEALNSLPLDSDDRCSLGRSFEHAVMKIVRNALLGHDMVTQERGMIDAALAAAVERVAVEQVPTTEQVLATLPSGYIGLDVDVVSDDDLSLGDPERKRVPVDSRLSDVACDNVLSDQAVRTAIAECSAHVVDPAPEMTREVMVLTMQGERDGIGAASVWEGEGTYEVRKAGHDGNYRVVLWTTSEADAFSACFKAVSWGVHVRMGDAPTQTPRRDDESVQAFHERLRGDTVGLDAECYCSFEGDTAVYVYPSFDEAEAAYLADRRAGAGIGPVITIN